MITPRIQRAIDVFLDSINNDTLQKDHCLACAVGNLVASGLGATLYHTDYGIRSSDTTADKWSDAFCTFEGVQHVFDRELENEEVQKCVEATEFSMEELMQIEYAFETNTSITCRCFYSKEEVRADQIKGLEAVVRVMMTFDDCKDDVKEVFTHKAEQIELVH